MKNETLRKAGLGAALLAPLGLLHAFVLAEICIGVTDVLFLVTMVRTGNFAWAKKPWFVLAVIWWVWLVICSTPVPALGLGGAGWKLGFAQAVVVIRLLVFTAALQNWLLTTEKARRALWLVLALSCLWIGVEAWQQYLTGRNIFGNPRWPDGSLTGPFWKPRAGQLYAHLLFTAMLPPVLAMFLRGGTWRLAGAVLALLGVVTSVLIGQRMGVCLTGLGLVVAAIFIPRLRRLAVLGVAAGIAVLALTPIISPATHGKLVGETQRNFHHFSQSPYGEIFTRATVMGLQSPLHGWGYNGYRVLCPEPRFSAGLGPLPPTSLALYACIQHPQNYYIQAFADAGFPGLFLFVALMGLWMWELGRGLLKNPDPLRVGLFISVLSFTWPIASTDEFPALYMLGWMFLLLGLGLVYTDISANPGLDAKHG